MSQSAQTLDLMLAAEPASVAEARHALATFARSCGVRDLWPVRLAISEAVGNAVQHAYARSEAGRRVRVRAQCEKDQLRVAIEDEGGGLRPRLDSPGLGLGIALMRKVAQRLEIEERPDGGLRVELCFALAANRH